ncbi:unnamed protein product, partial [Meganyctiphanes norvegica]|uniref:BPTI/Kunitz inhibitor domain-containing protein n=1 Tax=Meganyctiphanes norvegica TaxID=48144 RepID=A0AAV2SUB5_MEGNR
MMSSVSLVLSLALFSVVRSQGIVPGIANQCFEPVSSGPCRAFIPSFAYNPLTATCDCFFFGGCRGNGNKFVRLDECMNTCSVKPQIQTITPACIRIFGADNANFAAQPVTSRPVGQLPIVTDFPAVTAKAIPTTARPTTPRPTTPRPTTPRPRPTTARPTTARPAPVIPAAPVVSTSNRQQTSAGPTIQQGNLVVHSFNSDFHDSIVASHKASHDAIVASVFGQGGLTGHTTIAIGQPVFFRRSNKEDDDDK